jgi:hypothetical protein
MKHGISELEWNDYLDGRAATEVRDRIEAHMIGCLECWESYERLSGATEELHSAGEEARQGLTVDDRQLHLMLRGTFSRLRADNASPAVSSQVQGRLNQLETVLAPFCGAQAAVFALHAAAQNSPARSLDQVTPENWAPFLERLATLATAMCGATFAGLVRESGRF